MTRFRERNQALIGAVTILVIVVAVIGALNFSKLPLVRSTTTYRADFPAAGSLVTGDIVTVAGVREGQITGLALHGDRVRVTFAINAGVRLGADTGAAAKVLTPIGQEYLELTPAGPGKLTAVIPLSRTSIPSTLVSDLNTFGSETSHYNLSQLEKAIAAAGQTLGAVPARALTGLARFSQILAGRQSQLATLISQGAKLTTVLTGRSHELIGLVGQGDLVLKVLDQRRRIIRQLLATTAGLSRALSAILVGDRSQLGSLLANLRAVSGVLAGDSTKLADAIPVLAAFDRYAANASGSGPFVDTVIPATLIPDNVVAECDKQVPLNRTLGCRG
jgi:phospholipid/cholesterol/gamma-HCH transport system substrate-binding protein